MIKITTDGAPANRSVRIARYLALVLACFAAVTCDLVTAPKAGSGPGVTFALASADTLVVGTPLTIDVNVTQSGTPLQGARLEVLSSNTNVIDVVSNSDFSHTLNPKARGQAIIVVRLIGSSFGDNPPSDSFVVFAVAAKVIANRASATMRALQDTLTFSAKVFDGNNTELVDQASAVRWTSSAPAVLAIDNVTGKATAIANGSATVTGTVDSSSTTATVTVQQQVAHYTFTPTPVVIGALGATAQITATPRDSGGTAVSGGGLPTLTFASRRPGSITVSGSGLVTGNLNDTAFVVVTTTVAGSPVADSVRVEVGQVAQQVIISQNSPITKDALNDTANVTAVALDSRGVTVSGRSIFFTSRNSQVARQTATSTTGATFALDRTGSAIVVAQMDAAKDSITISVSNIARALFVSPDTLRFTTVDDTIPLNVQVRNSRGDTVSQAGTGIAWQSLDTTIATVDTVGRVWAHAVGTGRVRATIPTGTPDTTVIRVQNLATSVDLVPAALTLASIGDTTTVATNIRNARNRQLGAASVQWSSTAPAVATVGTGFVTAQSAGTAYIIAVDSLNTAHRDSVLINVTNAPASVTLDHHLDTLHALTTKHAFTATVRNAKGVTTAQQTVTWHSSNTSVITVDASGNVTAQGVGTAFVAADTAFGGSLVRDSAKVIVQNDIDHIVVAQFPLASIASLLDTLTLQATAVNLLGGQVSGVPFQWSTSDPTIASVTASTGLVTALQVGSVNITASVPSAPGVAPVTTRVDISNLPTFVDITPTSILLASVGDTVLPPVTLKNKLGAVLPRGSAQWISDNPAVVFVTHDSAIAVSRGSTYVRARNSVSTQIQDSVLVTVTNAPVTASVTPTLDSLPSIGRTRQLAVSFTNARGAPILNEPVTWTSQNNAIAQVSSTGLVTSVGIGNTRVLASSQFNAKTDSAFIRVSNFAATVSITPGAASLASVNATQLLTQTPRNEAGGIIVGSTPTWTSSNPSIVAFLPSGTGSPTNGPISITRDTMRVVAVAVGTASITATVDGVPTSITVTVANAPTTIAINTPDTTLASIGDAFATRVTIQNGLGATLPNTAVLWSTSDQTVATVSSTGLVTAIGRGGPVTITATSPSDATLFSTFHVTVSNAPVSLTITPSGPTLTAIGATQQLTATVRNAAGAVIGSPVPAVTWGSNNGSVSVGLNSGIATANSNGSATITATAGAATNNTTVFVTQAASTAKSTISASSGSIVANGVATATITVQLKDANGVSLTTSGGTVTMTLTGTGSLGSVTNNNNGTYTAILTAPTALGTGSVSAAVNGSAISTGDPQVQYVAGAATRYIVTSNNGSPVAGSGVTISAQLADANNNPVTTARTVTWSSTGGGSFGAPTSPTNGSGIATVTFTTNSAAGTSHQVTATDNAAITGTSNTFQTIAGTATNYLVTPSSTSPPAGSGITITAQLRDVNNNAVSQPGQTVTWSKTAGGSFGSPTSTTNANGTATVTLTTAAAAGNSGTVTATTGGINGTSATITTTAGSASPLTSTITASAGSFVAGGSVGITVQLKDAGSVNNTTSGGTVTLTAAPGGSLTVTDNGNGTYSATLSATATGSITVTGTLNGAAITDNEVVTVTVGPANAAASSATVPTGSAGNVTTITVQAKDQFGNNRSTTSGVVAASVTGANNATAGVVDNGNGTYTVTYTPTATGSDAIAITLGGSPIGGSPYTSVVTSGAVTSFLVEQSGGGSIVGQTAGGSFNIRITAKDAGGNTVTSFTGTVDLTSTSSIAAGGGTTGAFTSGVLSSRAITLTSAGSETITATRTGGGPNGTSNSFTVSAGAASAAQTTAVVPAGNAGQVTTISVQAKDAFGNNRTSSSGTVTVAVTGANTATGSVTNNNDGTYTATYTPSATGSDIVAIKLGGSSISGSPFTSAVTAGGLNHFAVTNTSGTSITSKTAGTAFNIMVTAQDASNNTVTGFTGTVNLTSTGSLTFTNPTASFVNGVLASTSVTITSTGSITITATNTAGVQTGTSNSFTVNPGALDHFNVEENPGGAISQQNTGAGFDVLFSARDVNNNLVTSFSSGTNKVTVGSTACTLTAGSGLTTAFSSGTKVVTVTVSPAATACVITASGSSKNGSSNAFAVFGPISAATSVVSVSPSNTVASGSLINLTLTAKDAAGNLIGAGGAGATVTFTAAGGSSTGTFGGNSPATDNGDGTYSATFTGVVAGTATTIGANIGASPTTSTQSVTVTFGSLDHFVWNLTTPQTTAVAFAGTNTLTAADAAGNTITNFDASANSVTVTLTSTGTVSGLGSGGLNVLDQAADFVNGVADLSGKLTYTRSAAEVSATFIATSAVGAKTGTSAPVTIGP